VPPYRDGTFRAWALVKALLADLRAAREAFAESGYGVPLDEIAARAGVGDQARGTWCSPCSRTGCARRDDRRPPACALVRALPSG